MLLKKENGQLILPESMLRKYGVDIEYFHVVSVGSGISITPAPEGPKEKRGSADLLRKSEGKFWMSDDFNETPEEFAEYM